MDADAHTTYVQWPKKIRVRGRQLLDLLFSQNFRKKYSFFRSKIVYRLTFYVGITCVAGYTVQYGIGSIPRSHNTLIRDAYQERGMLNCV